jgi:hypothetical protein
MSNLVYRNKSAEEWIIYFKIPFSTDITIMECRQIDAQIIGLYQEATGYKVIAESRLSALETMRKTEASKKFVQLYNSYKDKGRVPAKDTLFTLIDVELSSIDEAITLLFSEVNFWKGILHMLDTTRKLIETIAMSHGIEAKALNYAHTLKD